MNIPQQLTNSIETSNKVRIGKTTYDILSVSNTFGFLTFTIQAHKRNQTKSLMQQDASFVLMTDGKRSTMPKFVTPEFI
ncbi:MAG: hypothetical protein KME47_09895 [Nodosilinea sp. WJT8-NPBG4]|jgi:hypothetical protein|nr:hypothetical protein [Nodosilinea sp. WJT8-NPBG4]